ncbi:MAG: molecular chaperone DnaJ [Candidatus Sungbacteria bacterium]|nr:molecular chaperone DnaJ [Candidatus Sungbacteria bacterium]
MRHDYYDILGVSRNASPDEVKKAYRKLAHQYHPDKGGGNETKFKEINEAYQVLGDEKKRKQYDQFGQGAFDGGQGFPGGGFQWGDIFGGRGQDFRAGDDFDIGDIFENVFGFGGARRETRQKRGKDLLTELTIPFEESILGGKETITVRRNARCAHCNGTGGEPGTKFKRCETCKGKGNVQKTERTILGSMTRVETCPTCRGRGEEPQKSCWACGGKGIERKQETIELIIPKGIRNDDTLKVSGKGELNDPTGVPGDLYIRIRVLPHKVFKRQGEDLYMALPIKVSQAILGDTVEIPTLTGAISLKIPEGTQSGEILRIRGKGVPEASGYGHGDLLVEIKIDIPRRTSKQLRELMQKLRDLGL